MSGKHGGARPGAGRPRKEPQLIITRSQNDPLKFLLAVMNNGDVDVRLRIQAASAAAPFFHARARDFGKKQISAERARKASIGKFAQATPPKVVSIINREPKPK
jgi:phage terminase small subunit